MATYAAPIRSARTQSWLPAPALVQWYATLRCQLFCPHCLAATDAAGFDDMPLPSVYQLIDEVRDLGVSEFLLTGGEPTARQDLPAVIEYLGRQRQPFSINTAVLPNADQRHALERFPPRLAAVSLDGPEVVHDAFRGRRGAFTEAVEALRFYRRLPGCRIVAGTTVTAANYSALKDTFRIVAHLDVDEWGIHLPVPEGRAASRQDLFLSRRQLSRLLRFVAARRRYFPVQMADEFAYCGEWEPLVRDFPHRCGAGRTHCVVLPDGSVVPCTTLDRSTAAGSIHERPLAAIWRDGFAALRQWSPSRRCGKCEYNVACHGGCWLLRRHGQECLKPVWHVPQALKTAAGVALCLGVFGGTANAQDPAEQPPVSVAVPAEPEVQAAANGIDGPIFAWYADLWISELGDPRTEFKTCGVDYRQLPSALAADPGGAFFEQMRGGKLPDDLARRCELVNAALKTKQRSLALAALLWRALAEDSLTGKPPAERTAGERQILRETLGAIGGAAEAWRREVFEKELDPYMDCLRYDRIAGRSFVSKAGPRWPEDYRQRAWVRQPLVRDTGQERWGWEAPKRPRVPPDNEQTADLAEVLMLPAGPPTPYTIPEDYLKRHRYAATMELVVSGEKLERLHFWKPTRQPSLSKGDLVTVHDVIIVPAGADVTVSLRQGEQEYSCRLPAGTELTYADLLRLVYDQNKEKLQPMLTEELARMRTLTPMDPETNVFLVPGGLATQKELQTATTDAEQARQAIVAAWLADFWLF